jgi:hypothetical protein
LAGTIIPIMYSPSDISDFSISVTPVYLYKNMSDNQSIFGGEFAYAEVKIYDYHKYLRPYRYDIFLQASNLPDEVEKVYFEPPWVKPNEISRMNILLRTYLVDYFSDYPIRIQGIGGDGKIRNTTFYLSIGMPFLHNRKYD